MVALFWLVVGLGMALVQQNIDPEASVTNEPFLFSAHNTK